MIEQSIFSSRPAFKLSTQYQTKTPEFGGASCRDNVCSGLSFFICRSHCCQMLKNRQELNMQVKILVFSLLWSLTLGCKSSPPPPPKESCDYCPECARVNTGHIGGSSNFATIKDVSIFSHLVKKVLLPLLPILLLLWSKINVDLVKKLDLGKKLY